MSDSEAWTVKRLLEWTTDYFSKTGSSSSRLDAEILLAHVLDWQRINLYTGFDFQPNSDERAQYRSFIKHRAAGTPVAHLIGSKEFYSMDFLVNGDVLIPRPETEFAVVRSLDLMKTFEGNSEIQCLDLCTGSGAIGIALAAQEPRLKLTATDISRPALEVAKINVEKHNLSQRIRLIESDLFEAFSPNDSFHVIVSNPPYIGTREKASLSREVVDFEPNIALFSGEDGRNCSLDILRGAPTYLVPGGWLVMESSPFIIDQLAAEIEQSDEYCSPAIERDLAGHKRILSAQKA